MIDKHRLTRAYTWIFIGLLSSVTACSPAKLAEQAAIDALKSQALALGGDALVVESDKDATLTLTGGEAAGTSFFIPAGSLPDGIEKAALIVHPAGLSFSNPDKKEKIVGPVVTAKLINLADDQPIETLQKDGEATLPVKNADPGSADAGRLAPGAQTWEHLPRPAAQRAVWPAAEPATDTVAGNTRYFGDFAALAAEPVTAANTLKVYAYADFLRCDRQFDFNATPPDIKSLAYVIEGATSYFRVRFDAIESNFEDNFLTTEFFYPAPIELPIEAIEVAGRGDFDAAGHPERSDIMKIGCKDEDYADMNGLNASQWIYNFSEASRREFIVSGWRSTGSKADTCGSSACTLHEGNVRFQVNYETDSGGFVFAWYLDVIVEGATWHTIP